MQGAARGDSRSERSAGPASDSDAEIEAIADAYVELARGNVRLALSVSIADRIAATRLVSRGFARWGQPTPRRCLARR
jgi:hypothetical protein